MNKTSAEEETAKKGASNEKKKKVEMKKIWGNEK